MKTKHSSLLTGCILAGLLIQLSGCGVLNGSSGLSNNQTTSIITAASAATVALTLSDDQVMALTKESIAKLDSANKIAGLNSAYSKRLAKITKDIKSIEGIKPNFKVYITKDINAFACADGSIRIYSALMDVMDDDELMGIIGHEMGHVAGKDTKDAIRHAYLSYAAISALGATSDAVGTLTNSALGDIAQAFISAKYSRKQEYEADAYGFQTCIKYGYSPYGMANSLQKLVELSKGATASAIEQMFASHPDSAIRSEKMRIKADEYTKSIKK